ncbi:uncharacterized protein ASPGLDRAFT_70324 [Aspergillus glaucus CBS 516.65]|uniref:Azaphilone pigments biosynthesis cluster protein L N-terminal domain-containing protein n=1 Tax=Aspergillus glaucus CBS 516.65 TaxID=1160497 RepID=A0A1L9V566_ASPGL|nr:hypothetical protein ASPGLDRAFT_70324 [Aspergillus glaucus CBS 516.65]OJJ79074.1 hypothetical protein ASPGLDRAFT_70324 [Aspergillus glaucus CBS 516.65]
MDPLSITASVLAVVTAAVQSTKSLYDTVKRFKERDKTLHRLQNELEDLANILESLAQVTDSEMSMLALLQNPINRCSQVCRDFEQSMRGFSGKSMTGFRDWAKMEFMRGSINEFIDTIAGYKSTISVGLGTITIHASKVSHQVLQEYNEMIQDTAYNLEVHLQRIDEKMARFTIEETKTPDIDIDLKDEREVTQQCLRICEDAKSYIESLTNRESSVLPNTPKNATAEDGDTGTCFEAQLLTRQALEENQNGFAETIHLLQKRLQSLILNKDRNNEERLGLQEDIHISKQCLEVCKMASEVSHQKIYRIGEVVAEDDSDTKAMSKGNAAQLVGSMTEGALRHLADKRYNNRFGVPVSDSYPVEAGISSSPSVSETQRSRSAFPPQTGDYEQSPGPKTRRTRAFPNEMRKRGMGGAADGGCYQ